MTLLLKICAFALAAAMFGVFLKAQSSPLALPLELAAVAAIASALLLTLGRRFHSFFALLDRASLPASLPETVLKGAAVCLVSEFCAALCRESGNNAAARGVDLAGRALTVALCLPLCERLVQTVAELLAS